MSATKTTLGRLGYGPDARVAILHADDNGLSPEAVEATDASLARGAVTSTSVMVPCPAYGDAVAWRAAHPDADVGVHVTLTSEWPAYRWGPVAGAENVPSLVDADGFLWPGNEDVARNASAEDASREIRAQVGRAIDDGLAPTHIDTHMGAVFCRTDIATAYLDAAKHFGLPAATIEPDDRILAHYREAGHAIDEAMVAAFAAHDGPKLTLLTGMPVADDHDAFVAKAAAFVSQLPPGLHQLYVHPSRTTENVKRAISSWQQRAWEETLFAEPAVVKAMDDAGVVRTTWRDVVARFRANG